MAAVTAESAGEGGVGMEGDRRESAVAIKGFERELICPACKELFTHPLILPCQHSICHKCVKEILFAFEDSFGDGGSESSNQSSPRIKISSSMDRVDRISRSGVYAGRKHNSLTPRSSLFPCPGCQRDIDLGERGINGLFRNFTLETIVERYRQAARAAIAIMCDFCKPPPQESTKSCMDCSASYCNECFKIHHPWGTVKAQHEYVGPTTNFRPKILMCPEHEMERVNMYCEICRRPVCHLCKLGGCHANHRVTTMSTAYKALKEKLSKDIEYLIGKESQVKAHITQLDLLLKETEFNSERAKQEAFQSFEKLSHILEEKKFAALRAIDASKNLRLEKLQAQAEEYQGLLENNGLVGYAQEVLKETDPSCFVQTAKQLHVRIQKATESLKSFRPTAESTFEDFVVDIAKQELVLGDLTFHSNGLEIPEINELQSRTYNKALISWEWPGKRDTADKYVLEYHKLNREDESAVWQEIEVCSKSKVISDLDYDSSYAFRVRGYKGSICSAWSREVVLHTPPAPVFHFLFDDKCGYNSEHLLLNPRRTSVESRAGFSLLLGSERVQTGCYTTLDYIIGDAGLTKGKHFWAFHVEPYSYLVKVGVVSSNKMQKMFHNTHDVISPRYEQDSGHDSGSEDAFFDSSQPFPLVTLGMKKFFIPTTPAASKDAVSRILTLPSCLGICLDCDKGKVGFYDAGSMKCLYECKVDCSGMMYPAFALMGGSAVHLEEPVTAKYGEYDDNDI
ncbi:E3 ubiquitin-protein ligase TRIM36 isoform X2 [Pezoporus occidentalis]|uniref:E3 ubiquitin-protein ligase TRIM36 isoform X2 n=1 Tax=Pezoporus occidentalis TaxID=407982 RepID=UPI002F915952